MSEIRPGEIRRSQETGVYQTSGLCDDFESYRLLLALLTALSAMQRFLLILICFLNLDAPTCPNLNQPDPVTVLFAQHQTSGLCDYFASYRLLLALLMTLSAMQRFLLIHECAMHMKNIRRLVDESFVPSNQ